MMAALLFGSFLVGPPLAIAVAILARCDADRRCARVSHLYWEIQALEKRHLDLAARAKRVAKKQAKARLARSQLLFGPWRSAA